MCLHLPGAHLVSTVVLVLQPREPAAYVPPSGAGVPGGRCWASHVICPFMKWPHEDPHHQVCTDGRRAIVGSGGSEVNQFSVRILSSGL